MHDYDVIVVGARCGGAPTAMLFARAGYRVLLLDRATFPSDTLSTNYIHQPGVARLARWGLLDQVVASGCPPLERMRYRLGDVELSGCASGVDGHRAAYAPRRHVLDKILVDAAVAAGAELREGASVSGLSRRGEQVTGVEYTVSGRRHTGSAALVVGADGMRSTVARLAGARRQISDPRMTCAYYTLWEGVPADFELYESPGRWVGAVPTHDDTTLVATYFPQEEFARLRSRAKEAYLETVRTTAPELWARMEGRRQTERLRGTGDQQNYFRTAHGPGWVLVGDAGHHKDSISARGITDAFLQAELLTEAVGAGLHDTDLLGKALGTFAERRDQDLMDSYRATLTVAQLDAREQRTALLRVIQADPELTVRYFDTVAGIRPIAELYTPDLMARLRPAG
ncbi:NAD(P)/FAD-dependent oxidoreductase [Streptomyces sp. NPDC057148]|uniref:NAD(P)/FAD-dependent oxidoreductase n=1 Tax=unclassified Streptomyces TaxID=2593676 RepID=UPI00362AE41E